MRYFKEALIVFLLIHLLPFYLAAANQHLEGDDRLMREKWEPIVFKTVGDIQLKLWHKGPPLEKAEEARAAIVFFYGGGWHSRRIYWFKGKGKPIAQRGMHVFLADYRAKAAYGGTPFDCLEDAKSAVRFIRANAENYGIDPHRIAASGGSAGGHLAAATALVEGFNAPDDPDVSCVPNALVLYSPVYDNSENGYAFDRVKEHWEAFSPFHNIKKGAPPNIVFVGEQDNLVPVETAEEWKRRMEALGTRSELHVYPGRGHTFYNQREDRKDVLDKTIKFLDSLGYLPESE